MPHFSTTDVSRYNLMFNFHHSGRVKRWFMIYAVRSISSGTGGLLSVACSADSHCKVHLKNRLRHGSSEIMWVLITQKRALLLNGKTRGRGLHQALVWREIILSCGTNWTTGGDLRPWVFVDCDLWWGFLWSPEALTNGEINRLHNQ